MSVIAPGEATVDPRTVAVVDAVFDALHRRGYATTEWWTSVTAALLSAVLAVVGVPGSVSTQVVAVLAPVVVAAVYALARTSQKTALASLVAADLFPSSPSHSGS